MDKALQDFEAAKEMPNDGKTKAIVVSKQKDKILAIIDAFLKSDERPIATA